MKVVIAIDSFKGCLSSFELAQSIESGIKDIYKHADVRKISIADGGEGTIEALVQAGNGRIIQVSVHDPLMEVITAEYGITATNTAIIEIAAASGLPLVPQEKRDPSKTSTFGTGELIKDALAKGCREFIIGLGGSATNDGGLGMLQALGYTFLDKDNKELPGCGESLWKVATIGMTNVLPALKESHFLIACDVDNPFHGKNGASYVFAGQKGADKAMIKLLDQGLADYALTLKRLLKIDLNQAGAGAAGGLGGAFIGFLNSELQAGIEIVLNEVHMEESLKGADFVITGEGRIDFQSSMGKAPTGVSKLCQKDKIPVIALAGSVSDDAIETHKHGITSIFSILDSPMTLSQAMDKETAKKLVKKQANELFRLIQACGKS